MESLFEQSDVLVVCKDQTRNDFKDLITMVSVDPHDNQKLIGTVIRNNKIDLKVALNDGRAAANSYGNNAIWVGEKNFELKINMDIPNPTRAGGGSYARYHYISGNLDYTDITGSEVHSALVCSVKQEAILFKLRK
ncbi:MAG: hypothetical protein ACXVB4_13950 [Pseudobdellovibrionaceae bacterium]